eukprot:138716_1
MEHFDKATLDLLKKSFVTSPDEQNNENKVFSTELNDGDYDSNDATPKPTISKTSRKSLCAPHNNNINNNIFSDSEPGDDDPMELTAMRETLQHLVHREAQKSGMNINIPPTNEQPKYGDDPNENHIITLMNQESLRNVIQTVAQRSDSVISPIHPAVQKLYEQQQTLLQKLQLLEKDDPNPHSVKLWNIMQRIFTEENAQERQKNIEDLTYTLDRKHREVTIVKHNSNGDDKLLLKNIHELSKQTNNELKEMRQQLNEERKANQELRHKIKKKNRQLRMLSSKQQVNNNENKDDNDDDDDDAPMAYDPNTINGQHRNH